MGISTRMMSASKANSKSAGPKYHPTTPTKVVKLKTSPSSLKGALMSPAKSSPLAESSTAALNRTPPSQSRKGALRKNPKGTAKKLDTQAASKKPNGVQAANVDKHVNITELAETAKPANTTESAPGELQEISRIKLTNKNGGPDAVKVMYLAKPEDSHWVNVKTLVPPAEFLQAARSVFQQRGAEQESNVDERPVAAEESVSEEHETDEDSEVDERLEAAETLLALANSGSDYDMATTGVPAPTYEMLEAASILFAMSQSDILP